MIETFADILKAGGKSNSLGRAQEVIDLVLQDKTHLDELYDCLFEEDPWARMRAADAIEKVCRQHPEWLLPYIDRFLHDFTANAQPSIQWHMAQIFEQVSLTPKQKTAAIAWLKQRVSTVEVDWIVAANAMDTLAYFVKTGDFPSAELTSLLKIQQQHKSPAVIKRANKLLANLL